MNLAQALRKSLSESYPRLKVLEIEKIDQGLSNFNFLLIEALGRKIFAKIFRDANAQEATRESALVSYLNANGFRSPKIYATASGASHGMIGKRPFILYEYLEGHHPEAKTEDVVSIARLMAAMHRLPAKHDMQSGGDCFELLEFQLGKIVKHLNVFEGKLLLKTMQLCGGLKNSAARKGIVHTDIFLDNCIKCDTEMYLLDFENARFDYFLFDIGRAMLGCCLHNGRIDLNLAQDLLSAYSKIKKLTKMEWDELYEWLIFSILISIVWRYIEFNIKRPHESRQQLYQAFMPALEQMMALKKNHFLCMMQTQELAYAD